MICSKNRKLSRIKSHTGSSITARFRFSYRGIPCEDPFGENEPDDIVRLREFAASLSGRMADIYEWLLVKYAGGQVKLSLQAIADKWGISTTQIYKDKDRLLRMIREHVAGVK